MTVNIKIKKKETTIIQRLETLEKEVKKYGKQIEKVNSEIAKLQKGGAINGY